MLGKLCSMCWWLFFVHISGSNLHSGGSSDIPTLDVPCPPHDICSNATADNYGTFCDCGPSCVRYGTCCLDSPFANTKPGWRRSLEECSSVRHSDKNIFVVSKCHPGWRGSPVIRCMCEMNRTTLRDPVGIVPVTSKSSNTTYKNYFCALCNEDHVDSVLWDVRITIPVIPPASDLSRDEKKVLQALEYHVAENQWGIWNRSVSGDWEFLPVAISFNTPGEVSSLVKRCRSGMVSQCAPSWQDMDVQDKCEAYMAPVGVFVDPKNYVAKTFRNVHCAICNHVTNFTGAWCSVQELQVAHFPTLSLSLLLDVNRSDGDEVGVTKKCSDTEVYDPFFKKCRALSCALPGFILKDGKCVRS